jgi:signal transduction histidine kinase
VLRAPLRFPIQALSKGSFSPSQAVGFLSDEIPVRNSWLLRLIQSDAGHFAAIPPFGDLAQGLERSLERPPAGGEAAAVATVAHALSEQHERFEASIRALVPALRDLNARSLDMGARAAVQRVARHAHQHLVSQRVLLAQLETSLAEGGEAAEPRCEAICDLGALCASTSEEAALFCREKHGDSSEVRVELPDAAVRCCTVPAYARFALTEVLKNALGAHVRRYGVLDVCDAPPVELRLAAAGSTATVRVSDRGDGMSRETRRAAQRYFYTTNDEREPNYTYSRAFGSQFDGLGVGLPLAEAHLRYLGGDLVLTSMPGEGSCAYLTIDRTGGRLTDPPVGADEFGEEPAVA